MALNLIEQFQSDCIERNMSSWRDYVFYAREFSNFLAERNKKPADVTKDDLRLYLAKLRARSLKQTSIERIFSCLSGFYTFLIDEGLTTNDPIRPFRRRYLRRYKDESSSESRKIISVEEAAILVNSILDSRDKAIVTLIFKTGMRSGELCRLDIGEIDLENMILKLKRTAKRSNCILFFDRETADLLRIWMRVRGDRKKGGVALFTNKLGGRISPLQVNRIVKKYAARIGLHDSNSERLEDQFTPHCCRH